MYQGDTARRRVLLLVVALRAMALAGAMRPQQPGRPRRVGPYLPFMRETLAKFPTLTARRLHTMVQARG